MDKGHGLAPQAPRWFALWRRGGVWEPRPEGSAVTANRKQKKSTRDRAAAQGVPYLVARRDDSGRGGVPSARGLRDQVAELLGERGWPVTVEPNPQFGDWVLYSGPMRLAVTDPGLDPSDDFLFSGPDEARVAAAEQIPAGEVCLWAPFLSERPNVAYADLPAGSSAEQIVAAAARALGEPGPCAAPEAARGA